MNEKQHFSYPIGYIERLGDCVIKKVQSYGKKYKVYRGQIHVSFGSIRQAREYALKYTSACRILPL